MDGRVKPGHDERA